MDPVEREYLILQIMLNTKYTESALKNMSDAELIDYYKNKVEPNMK